MYEWMQHRSIVFLWLVYVLLMDFVPVFFHSEPSLFQVCLQIFSLFPQANNLLDFSTWNRLRLVTTPDIQLQLLNKLQFPAHYSHQVLS